jgi:hypothetical protein
MAKVSLIVVNHNGRDFIVNCLRALEGQLLKDFEIIIIDNGSSDGSLVEIQKLLNQSVIIPLVKIVSLEKNIGFAGGNLEGLRHANGEYIALLNNDTEPDKGWLGELVKAMDNSPDVGICASKLIVHGTNLIDSAGDGFSTALRGFKREEGKRNFSYKERDYIFGACAGAALYRRKMIEEIGFLDEDFFLIHEDTDLNFRAQLHGWKVLYVPTAQVYHKVRSSIGSMSDMAIYYTVRNSEFVRIKNIPFGVFMRCLPEFLIGALTEFVYFAIKHKRLRLYFKAKIDALRMFPRMLKKRTIVMKNKKISNRYLLNIMTPIWQKDFLITKIKKFLYA